MPRSLYPLVWGYQCDDCDEVVEVTEGDPINIWSDDGSGQYKMLYHHGRVRNFQTADRYMRMCEEWFVNQTTGVTICPDCYL